MATVLEEKPKNTIKDVPKKVIKAEGNTSKLPKWAVLYFGDTVGKITLIQYLKGEVMGNINHIDPAKQLVLFVGTTNDATENSKVKNGLDTLMKQFGTINEVTDIKTEFKNQSDAYLHSFNNDSFLTKVIETMGDDIQFLVFTFDHSCFSGLNRSFNVAKLETFINNYNAANPDKPPKRLIYENVGRDIYSLTQKYFDIVRELYNQKKDDVANGLLDNNIEIDTTELKDEKTKEIAANYFKIADTVELPLGITAKLDDAKTFYVRQYKK